MIVRRDMLANALLIAVYGATALFLMPVGTIRGTALIDAISFTGVGFLLAAPVLLALWATLADRSCLVPWLQAIWFASAFGLLVGYAQIRHEGNADLDRDLPACLLWLVVLVIAELPLSALRRCGWRLRLIAAPDALPSHAPSRTTPRTVQMTVRQMLVGITAIGCILAGMRWLFPKVSFDGTSTLWTKAALTSAAIGAAIAVVTLPVYPVAWCLLGVRRIRLRVALAGATAALLGGLGLLLWRKADHKTAVGLSCMIPGMILSAAMTLTLWRACGYRLIRLSRDTPLAVDPPPEARYLSFVLALVPPVAIAVTICGYAPHRLQLWLEADEVERWAEENIGVEFADGTGKIIELWCPEMKLSDALLKRFAKLDGLTLLDLSGTDLDDRQLALLLPLENLRTLYLGRTQVTDEGIVLLPKFPNLQCVMLEMTGVTDEAIDALSRIDHLKDVDLSWSGVTEQGQSQLRDVR